MEFIFMASVVASGASQIIQGQESQEAAEAEAKTIRQSAEFNEILRKQKVRKLIGRQLAQAAEGGFTRSAQEIIEQTALESELQGQIDFYNSEVQARRLENFGTTAAQTGLIQGLGTIGTGAFIGSQLGVFDKFKFRPRSRPFLPEPFSSNNAMTGFLS
jgi:hypothetical protein